MLANGIRPILLRSVDTVTAMWDLVSWAHMSRVRPLTLCYLAAENGAVTCASIRGSRSKVSWLVRSRYGHGNEGLGKLGSYVPRSSVDAVLVRQAGVLVTLRPP